MKDWYGCCSWEENSPCLYSPPYVWEWFIFPWANPWLAAISREALKGKARLVRVYLKIPGSKAPLLSSSSTSSLAICTVKGEWGLQRLPVQQIPSSPCESGHGHIYTSPILKPEGNTIAVLAWRPMWVIRQLDLAVLLQLNNDFFHQILNAFPHRRKLSMLEKLLFPQALTLSSQSEV